jgi:predicted dehydrogenase
MSHKPVGIGLVGAGGFGRFCLEVFAAMPEVRIAAIADVDETRAHELASKYGAHAYHSVNDLLRDESVQIVALNTPPYLHAEQGLSSLQAGKHLFCEKPLALTVEDGEKLLRTAAENNLLLTVDYVMRHNPFWESAARLAQSGLLGKLRHMDLANHAAGLELPVGHWFWDKSKSGGIWIEHGVHFFDAFAWVSGQRGEIVSSHGYCRADGVNDRVEALAPYGDTGAHFYHAFDKSSKTEQTTVQLTFERGYVTLREWVPTSIEILTDVDANALNPLLPGMITRSQQNGCEIVRAFEPNGKSFLYQRCIQTGMSNLVAAVRDSQLPLSVTGAMAVESLRMAITAEQLSLM